MIGFVALGRGDLPDARRWLDEALTEGEPYDDVEIILPPLWGLAELALVAGDPAAAAERCARALAIAERTGERPFFVPFVVTGTRALLAAAPPGRRGALGGSDPSPPRGMGHGRGRRCPTPKASCG